MGNKIIKPLARSTMRPLKNYDVEQRAIKAISKDKPTPAPPHPSMKKIMEDIKNDPELLKKGQDPVLGEKLAHIYLTSQGDNPVIKTKAKLPVDREHPAEFEYGYEEPTIIPEGKASMKQILQFLSKHQNDPEQYKGEDIAAEYKLDIEQVNSILKYFQPFRIHYPEKKPQQSGFMKAIKA